MISYVKEVKNYSKDCFPNRDIFTFSNSHGNMKNTYMILSQPLIVDSRVSRETNALVDARQELPVIVWDRNYKYEPEAVVDGTRVIRIHNRG